jgi:acetylornithine deacetylase
MHTPPSLLEMIDALISTPSVSSVNPHYDQSNRAVIDLLASWLGDLGWDVEVLDVDERSDKADLIATLGSGPGGLVLAGHTDTVPYDEGSWQHDPFKLTRRSGRLYGLGTADMKAFLALAIEAAGRFSPSRFGEPLILVATADEESSMAGAQQLLKVGRPRARFAVIGEPTGLRPVRLHKGIMMERIRLHGHSGHSSDPSLGNSALEGMRLVLDELVRWRTELQAAHVNPLFTVPVPTLNLGHIHGGDNPNRICAECELHIDLRPLPGMDLADLRDTLHQRVHRAIEDTGLELVCSPLFEGTPAMETAASSEIVRCTEALTGHTAAAVAFGTEGPYFNQMGIDTVVLGPGDIDQAHQPDEYLEEARLGPTVELLGKLIDRFCVHPPSDTA